MPIYAGTSDFRYVGIIPKPTRNTEKSFTQDGILSAGVYKVLDGQRNVLRISSRPTCNGAK
jgi:hypothetical protein